MGMNLLCRVQEGKSFINVVERKRWISQRVSNGKTEETHNEIAALSTVLFLEQLIVIWAVRKRFPSLCGDQNFINFQVRLRSWHTIKEQLYYVFKERLFILIW